MKLLILGGTVFLGCHLVEAALAAGHEVTLFHRGRHGAELFPGVEKLHGDRDGDLSALEGRRWDAVLDTSGYVPRVVRQSARLLQGAVEHYTFVSSISVYSGFGQVGIDETEPVGTLADESVEEVTGETYGPLKALCEREVSEAFPGRSLLVRPGLIVGPHDPTDRFTYWPVRVARGGEVLAPGVPDHPVQWIDVRDLAEWMVRLVAARAEGVFNAVGPAAPATMGELLDCCRRAAGSDAAFTWVDEAFLAEQGVAPWSDLPLWVPASGDYAGFSRIDNRRALAAGLQLRPLLETAADTLAWLAAEPERELKAGLTAERERAVLQRWHER